MIRRLALLPGVVFALGVVAAPAVAERAWVKDECTIWMRSGPGNNYRNFRSIQTGDSVEILSRGDGWTQVRVGESSGWVPAGHLQPQPPAAIRLERQEADASAARSGFERISREAEELRAHNEQLASEEAALRAEVTRLSQENLELRAGARWPEWIAGASILFVGGILGVIVHWSSARRGPRRIRL